MDDVDLGGLNPADGRLKLQDWSKDKLAENISLVYNGTEVGVPLSDLGAELDDEKTWQAVRKAPGQAVSSAIRLDGPKFILALRDKLGKLTSPAKDASYKIEQDKFAVKPAVPGQSYDAGALAGQLESYSLAGVPDRIAVPVVPVPAGVSTESLKALAFDKVIGEYSTRYSVQEANRSANLVAAAKALDQKVVKPGETFSFNQTVGPRSAETGYKDAFIIINNQYVQGIGGGVCQVSTTLYNAVLLANLPIVERYPHAVAISYVPLGRDATVNYPNLDLKFKNDTTGLIYIRTKAENGVLTIRLFGKKSDKTVRLENAVEKEMDFQTQTRPDPGLPAGKVIQEQAGTKGYTVKSWRIVRDSQGKEIRQLLSRDQYQPANRILRVGI